MLMLFVIVVMANHGAAITKAASTLSDCHQSTEQSETGRGSDMSAL